MPALALFGLSMIFSFTAWGIVTAQFIWPELRDRSHVDALRPLLTLHTFRFIGLSFLIPGVVSPCVYRKLDFTILVVKATENWV